MPLTDTAIRNAKPKDKPYKLTDGEGMFLLVQPNGGKYWRLKYRHTGKEKLLALGTYPEISLLDAREKRLAARKLLAEGQDPSSKKQEEKRFASFKAQNTFMAVAEEWFVTNKPRWTPAHAARLWRRMEYSVFPEIGNRPIAEITSLELLEVFRRVEKRGATHTAHRLLQTCSAIFRYGVLTARTTYNPTSDLRGALVPHVFTNHPTIAAAGLPEFFTKLAAIDTTRQSKIAVKLVMLTFVRQGELRQAKWADIDFTANEWRLPAHTTKMRERHIVPLALQTVALLRELQALTGQKELLFPSQHNRRHATISENTINHVIHRMGYKGKMVGHGFRALASTTLNEMGFRPDIIERQLAHAERNKVRAAYNRAEYLAERREMMQHWADFMEKQAGGTLLSGGGDDKR